MCMYNTHCTLHRYRSYLDSEHLCSDQVCCFLDVIGHNVHQYLQQRRRRRRRRR